MFLLNLLNFFKVELNRMFSQEVFDDLEFTGGNDLNDVVLIDKVEVDKFHKKLLGHDGKVLNWIVFQVVIEPLLWVFFN